MSSRLIKVTLFAALMLALSAGAALAATLLGTPGPDSISGTSEPDLIVALEGDDFVDAFGGSVDVIYGNENSDELLGAEDDDKVYGNTGPDTINLATFDTAGSFDQGFGGAGNDLVLAQDGNFDAINCGGGTGDIVHKDPGDSAVGCESVNPTSASAVAAQEDAMEKAKELRASR
jgi:hypothetical protein